METACYYCEDSPNKDKPEDACKYHSPQGVIQLGNPSYVQISDDQFNPKWEKIIEKGK